MVHRPKYDDWSLPKGKPEDDEHLLQTAHREVAEETGLQVVVGRRSVAHPLRGAPARRPARAPRRSTTGRASGPAATFRANHEVDELRWLPLDEAAALCSHDHDRAVLEDLARTDVPLMPTLILLRHARAGSRSDWDGPDDLRPLDSKGRAQAQRLAEVLPVFAPTAVLSARRTRCEETAAPLAERLGLEVQPLDELGEEEFNADPAAGMAVLERLAGAPEHPRRDRRLQPGRRHPRGAAEPRRALGGLHQGGCRPAVPACRQGQRLGAGRTAGL